MDNILSILLVLIISAGTTIGVVPEKVTHDGTRTGDRVGYQSYCNPEQGVVIYENEKIPFTTDEGKQVLWTKGDIDCYKARKLSEEIPPTPSVTEKKKPQTYAQTTPIHDGTRTGKIISYKEYCSGKQISVYENEVIIKKSSFDGQTYGMTKNDWDCYNADPVVSCQFSPNCGGGTLQLRKSQCDQVTCCEIGSGSWYSYPNKTACSNAQYNYNSSRSNFRYTPPVWPTIYIPPVPTVAPYQYSQEYLDSLERANQVFSEPWQSSQFTVPATKCYASWDEYFRAHPSYSSNDITQLGTPPCD